MKQFKWIFVLQVQLLFGQMPETDIWIFSLKNEGGRLNLQDGWNTSNRKGYDNQPCFSADGKSFYYVRNDEKGQTDVYQYLIGKKESVQVTRTTESEYSPLPGKGSISCVVVEKDSTQRIWMYDMKSGLAQKFLFNEDSVGYYGFLNADTVIYYKLTSPHSLRVRSLTTGQDEMIASSVVRGFKAVNRHSFIFGIRDSLKVSFYQYDSRIRKALQFAVLPSLNEDIFWHEELGLLSSRDAAIYRYNDRSGVWELLFDLSVKGIKKITRFAIDGRNKWLTVVDNQ